MMENVGRVDGVLMETGDGGRQRSSWEVLELCVRVT